jgi:hypothetical protein
LYRFAKVSSSTKKMRTKKARKRALMPNRGPLRESVNIGIVRRKLAWMMKI